MKTVIDVIGVQFELTIALVVSEISIGCSAVVLRRGIERLGAVFDITKRTQVLDMRTIMYVSRTIRCVVDFA